MAAKAHFRFSQGQWFFAPQHCASGLYFQESPTTVVNTTFFYLHYRTFTFGRTRPFTAKTVQGSRHSVPWGFTLYQLAFKKEMMLFAQKLNPLIYLHVDIYLHPTVVSGSF